MKLPSPNPVAGSRAIYRSLWMLSPFATVCVAGGPIAEWFVGTPAGEIDEIEARDKYLFVFSPRCGSCVTAARRIPAAARRTVVGIVTRRHGDLDEFFSLAGYRFPVEFVTGEKWFDMLDRAPPAYYHIDGTGENKRVRGFE